MSGSLPPEYFEQMFAADPDPWQFETSEYEANKYQRTLGALDERQYAHGLEVGCANGVLTERLARRCKALVGLDVSSTALAQAKARCTCQPHVAFEKLQFPKEAPVGSYDLIVLSEVVYYWDDDDIARAAAFVDVRLAVGGDILLVHWIGATDYPQSGDQAVVKLQGRLCSMTAIRTDRTNQYRLDLWRR